MQLAEDESESKDDGQVLALKGTRSKPEFWQFKAALQERKSKT